MGASSKTLRFIAPGVLVAVAALSVSVSACGSDSDSSNGSASEDPGSTVKKGAGAVSPDEVVTFTDNFDGPAGDPPDRAKWVPKIQAPGPNGELQYYTDNKNATLDGNGNLVIEARKEDSGRTCPDPRSTEAEPLPPVLCPYTSGRLSTKTLFSQQGGRFEARVMTPMGNTEANGGGVWSAWWMLGRNGRPWPAQGEIDINESIGWKSNTSEWFHAGRMVGGAVEKNSYGGLLKDIMGLPVFDMSQFHIYAVEQEPDKITWYIDDTEIRSVTKADFEAKKAGTWMADQPWYMILNLAVGGWAGAPNDGLLPKSLVVDYVRASCPLGTTPFEPAPAEQDQSETDKLRVRCMPKPVE